LKNARSQSYDFGIYNYNASVILGYGVLDAKDFFVFKTHLATRGVVNFYSAGVVNFYSAGVVTHDRRIGSRV
jgi:hypothetical protein